MVDHGWEAWPRPRIGIIIYHFTDDNVNLRSLLVPFVLGVLLPCLAVYPALRWGVSDLAEPVSLGRNRTAQGQGVTWF